jgi:hypothetical protein
MLICASTSIYPLFFSNEFLCEDQLLHAVGCLHPLRPERYLRNINTLRVVFLVKSDRLTRRLKGHNYSHDADFSIGFIRCVIEFIVHNLVSLKRRRIEIVMAKLSIFFFREPLLYLSNILSLILVVVTFLT